MRASEGAAATLAAGLAVVLLAAGGPSEQAAAARADASASSPGRLTARPGGGKACAAGTLTLALPGPDALLRVTPGGRGPRGLLVALHGAGDVVGGGLWAFRAAWERPGLVILSPKSEGGTWSAADVPRIDRALARVFARCRIDPQRVAIGGFSDGATYALSLGLANGDLFGAVIALSPGGLLWGTTAGKPRLYFAHGRNDDVLPIARTSDVLVPALSRAGYRVTYLRFADGHQVARSTSEAAVRWLLRGWPGP